MALADFWFLMARTTWIESRAELDHHLPPYDGWIQRLARYIRFLL